MIPRFLVGIACAVGFAVTIASAGAAIAADDPAIRLTPRPAVLPGVAAFPEVGLADATKAKKINDALQRADGRVRTAARQCRGANGISWTRTIAATMRGPRFVSLLADDEWFCGAYPDQSRMALVYDLETAAPINWARYLPAALAGKSTSDSSGDGSRLGLLDSQPIAALWAKGVTEPQCRDVIETSGPPSFQLWPDTKAGGIAILIMTLPHVMAVCRETVTVPTATWRRLGVSAALLDAIDAAHASGRFDR